MEDVFAKKAKKDKKDKKDKKAKKDKKDKKSKSMKPSKVADILVSDSEDETSFEDLKKTGEVAPIESKKRRASFAEDVTSPVKKSSSGSGAPSKIRKTADPEGRPRTRSFDKGTAIMASGKDESGNPPLTDFPLHSNTMAALLSRGITHLFPIQAMTFSTIFEGKDVIGRARTGCGKTLAFALPVAEKLRVHEQVVAKTRGRAPLCLTMCPTRELAMQVAKEFQSISPYLSHTCIYGGASYEPQKSALWKGVDVVVGTPGRMIDHIEQGTLKVGSIKYFILDEADQMLDMGFQEEIQKVVDAIHNVPGRELQTLLFSATLPSWVAQTAKKYMRSPTTIDLVQDDNRKAATSVKHLCIKCPWQLKPAACGDSIRVYGGSSGRAIVFCETKKECNDLMTDKNLTNLQGGTAVLHGDIPQAQRERTMQAFRDSRVRILIATDVAARGLDVSGVDLVIQTQPPCKNFSGRVDTETYVHRSGRTGRAGRKGTCITFFTHAQEPLIKGIERVIGNKIQRIGTPQMEDLAEASGMAAMEKCLKVDKRLLIHFQSAVKELLKVFDTPENALAAALAQIAGYYEFKPRSLLSAEEGFKTVMFQSNLGQPMSTSSYVWSHIRREFNPVVADQVRGMTLTADEKGAVFDIRAKDVPEFEQYIKKKGDGGNFSFPKELPEMKAREQSPTRFGGRGGRSFGNSRGRGRGGRGGGGGGSRTRTRTRAWKRALI